jgi:hypothetical protein
MYVCGGINLTKTFHVKHFGTIARNITPQKVPAQQSQFRFAEQPPARQKPSGPRGLDLRRSRALSGYS